MSNQSTIAYLFIAIGLLVAGCSRSDGGSYDPGPTVEVSRVGVASIDSAQLVDGATNAVVSTISLTNKSGEAVLIGGLEIDVTPDVRGVHLTQTNGVIVGVGTLQPNGVTWLITPVDTPAPAEIIRLTVEQTTTLQVRADTTRTAGQVHETMVSRLWVLNDGRTWRWSQGKSLELTKFIPQQPISATPTLLPKAGPLPAPINFKSPVISSPSIPYR